MFCSSLRKRRVWASVVPDLLKTSAPYWRESSLTGHDVAFPIKDRVGLDTTFKLVLLSTLDVSSSDGKARLERLSILTGGRHAAVILLLNDEDSIMVFSQLQMDTLGDLSIPIIPISSSRELPACLTALRQQYSPPSTRPNINNGELYDLAPHFVKGKSLSRDQANVLTSMSSGFRELANHVTLPYSQALLKEYLGDTDGERVVSFFIGGPTTDILDF